MPKRQVVAAVAVLLTLTVSSGRAQRPAAQNSTLAAAVAAMGSTLVGNMQFTATGSMYALGQSFQPDGPWPAFKLTSYKLDVDYQIPAMRLDLTRTNPDGPIQGGGGLPLVAPQRQIQSMRGSTGWNMADLNGSNAAAAPAGDRLVQIWSSPHGVIKAAQKAGAELKVTAQRGTDGSNVSVLTFPAAGTIIKATLNRDNLVERVETTSDNPVLGVMVTETVYSEYRDAKQISLTPVHPEDLTGVMFPTRIVQKQGGFPVLDLTVTSARPNAYMVFPLPDAIRQAATQPAVPAAPARVDVQKVADGVYYLTGGTHHSVAVEFKDYVALLEAPLDDARVIAVMTEVRKTIPNKPIRYVVNTHHHFDHSGGLRAAAAEGATIITQAANKPYYEKVLVLPRASAIDRLAKSRRKPTIEGVVDKRILTDGNTAVELYKLQRTDHADTMLIAYLPKEKLLVEADVFTPVPNAPAGPPNKEAANLLDNIQRLRLDVRQIAPLHGRLSTIDDLAAAAGHGRSATR